MHKSRNPDSRWYGGVSSYPLLLTTRRGGARSNVDWTFHRERLSRGRWNGGKNGPLRSAHSPHFLFDRWLRNPSRALGSVARYTACSSSNTLHFQRVGVAASVLLIRSISSRLAFGLILSSLSLRTIAFAKLLAIPGSHYSPCELSTTHASTHTIAVWVAGTHVLVEADATA